MTPTEPTIPNGDNKPPIGCSSCVEWQKQNKILEEKNWKIPHYIKRIKELEEKAQKLVEALEAAALDFKIIEENKTGFNHRSIANIEAALKEWRDE